MDILRYISTYIPREIVVDGKEYQFQLFINHAHYDLRIGYINDDVEPSFHLLYENIDSETALLEALAEMRAKLKQRGWLEGDYATDEGYDYLKYKAWLDSYK